MSEREILEDIERLIGSWFCALEDEGLDPWDEDSTNTQYFIRKYEYTKEDYTRFLSKIS